MRRRLVIALGFALFSPAALAQTPAPGSEPAAQEARAKGEQAMQRFGVKLPPGAPDLTPDQQKKLAHDVVKGMTESNRELLNQELPPPPTEKQALQELARAFFFAVTKGDARSIAMNSTVPFALEDQRIYDPQELFTRWLHHLRSKRTDLLVLYGVEVLTPDEMVKKYGPPPPRLQNFPWRSGKTFIAVGNLSGHAAVVIFKETRPGEYQLAGYTD